MTDAAKSRPGLAVSSSGARTVTRTLPEETPVAISFDGTTLAVMMASPADLEDFAYGFALTERVIDRPEDVETFEIIQFDAGIEARFLLRDDRSEQLRARQRALMGPVGCGLCGIDSLEGALPALPAVDADPRFSRDEVARATDELRAHQPLHDLTRAVHAAGFMVPGEGIVMAREDVGRHNALDKLIGALARAGIDPASGAMVITSRVSVEMVQKTAQAGCAVIVAASAPTAHALRLADAAQITLAAFVRGESFDLYSHPHRIQTGASDVA
ncbi:formate dehydrogenase accessory sulfurtransferase FdhD [Maritimibacter sp. UBA3975]|uniref:formate dehydrogenase accessory sulfurtransferase FdhD n=1 Tax=Maritimibacter sp. UBA3975 TaxID=1946833 RepID=UPI000C0B48B7|nr:formate dehydrogenase accessory sulfurtransferase FdhD [Maritimibacter sp. UBA3975]MAM62639.1 sulfurtransferase FdhD [Maritimibacter sp.]|tara:strand:+ start:22091 stop:22906 length:816 start_codon:yes stop_codon:yes gene_type:complete